MIQAIEDRTLKIQAEPGTGQIDRLIEGFKKDGSQYLYIQLSAPFDVTSKVLQEFDTSRTLHVILDECECDEEIEGAAWYFTKRNISVNLYAVMKK